MKKIKKREGITLVALIITVIIMLILAGVAINLTRGDNGIFKKVESSAQISKKEEATEQMNMKITSLQMKSYTEKQRLPNLQELADDLCEDQEIEYVELKSKETASLNKITVGENHSIFTKIKRYPYEFEINSQLQLASIDGVKIATDSSESARITELENEMKELKTTVALLKNYTKTHFIERKWEIATLTITANKWTSLEEISLAGYGSGTAIISCYISNPDNAMNYLRSRDKR